MVRKMINRVPAWVLNVFGLAFGLYHAALGVIYIEANEQPSLVAAAVFSYIFALVPTIWVIGSRKLPLVFSWLNLLLAIVIPIAVNSTLDSKHLQDYSTWYVLGIGTLLGATAVRGRRSFAWLGFLALVIEIFIWGGIQGLAASGLPGVLSLVVAGHAISVGVERAIAQTKLLNERASSLAAETAAVESAGQLRSRLVGLTLRTALPTLELIASNGGKLTAEQRFAATLLEAGLRDEIRGPALLNDSIRASIRKARVRGVEVLVLDEGGLDGIDAQARVEILGKVAEAVDRVHEGRLTLRAPRGEEWRVTVAAVRPGENRPDLWLKL
jgi:hypothetical protein